MIFRCFSEKKEGFDVEARGVLNDLRDFLGVSGLVNVRVLSRYDVSGVSREVCHAARDTVFSEPQTDAFYDGSASGFDVGSGSRALAVEALPGQFDQRADSCARCLRLLALEGGGDALPLVRTAKVYVFDGDISDADFDRIRAYLINPVDSREAEDGGQGSGCRGHSS
jgi:phosphoribosylformylglycinamidine synthase